MFRKKITFKILLFLVLSDFLETFLQFCFKKSTISAESLNILNLYDVGLFIKSVVSSYFLWIAFASAILIFVIWSTILSKIDLSVAVPVASFSYILVPLTSIVFLHEKINAIRWAGIIFILMGIIFTSLSSKERIEHKNES
ncbi:MAG: EamA family transporter [Candidatus Omnitrophica bacterium]|nr:EamA family transporter [Candidatus Omnitrophota bacterium]